MTALDIEKLNDIAFRMEYAKVEYGESFSYAGLIEKAHRKVLQWITADITPNEAFNTFVATVKVNKASDVGYLLDEWGFEYDRTRS